MLSAKRRLFPAVLRCSLGTNEFLKKAHHKLAQPLVPEPGTPVVTPPQGAGRWQNPPGTSRTRWHADVGQRGGCFCPLALYLPPVPLPPARTTALVQEGKKRGRRWRKGEALWGAHFCQGQGEPFH